MNRVLLFRGEKMFTYSDDGSPIEFEERCTREKMAEMLLLFERELQETRQHHLHTLDILGGSRLK